MDILIISYCSNKTTMAAYSKQIWINRLRKTLFFVRLFIDVSSYRPYKKQISMLHFIALQ